MIALITNPVVIPSKKQVKHSVVEVSLSLSTIAFPSTSNVRRRPIWKIHTINNNNSRSTVLPETNGSQNCIQQRYMRISSTLHFKVDYTLAAKFIYFLVAWTYCIQGEVAAFKSQHPAFLSFQEKRPIICYGFKTPCYFPNQQIYYQIKSLLLSSQYGKTRLYMIYAPPGSGYHSIDDEVSELPSTYEPMMEYPGTMRPGKTPENMPFQDLPIGDDDPDPVPWPHFQQHEWHTTIWSQYPPHEHPVPMEQFIELQGRWATPEMEASMRSGIQQRTNDMRQQQQRLADELKNVIPDDRQVITDDDDDDDEEDNEEDEFGSMDSKKIAQALGDGIFGKLGSDDDKALTAAATSATIEAIVGNEVGSSPQQQQKKKSSEEDDDMMLPPFDDEEDLDDFLLGLGLDSDLDLGDDVDDDSDQKKGPATIIKSSNQKQPAKNVVTKNPFTKPVDDDDDMEEDDSVDDEYSIMDPLSLGTLGLDDDDEDDLIGTDTDDTMMTGSGGVNTVPLEAFGDSDSLQDSLEENIFDEGGFDFDTNDDDYGDMGGGDDMW
jgi:hypothetical protein